VLFGDADAPKMKKSAAAAPAPAADDAKKNTYGLTDEELALFGDIRARAEKKKGATAPPAASSNAPDEEEAALFGLSDNSKPTSSAGTTNVLRKPPAGTTEPEASDGNVARARRYLVRLGVHARDAPLDLTLIRPAFTDSIPKMDPSLFEQVDVTYFGACRSHYPLAVAVDRCNWPAVEAFLRRGANVAFLLDVGTGARVLHLMLEKCPFAEDDHRLDGAQPFTVTLPEAMRGKEQYWSEKRPDGNTVLHVAATNQATGDDDDEAVRFVASQLLALGEGHLRDALRTRNAAGKTPRAVAENRDPRLGSRAAAFLQDLESRYLSS